MCWQAAGGGQQHDREPGGVRGERPQGHHSQQHHEQEAVGKVRRGDEQDREEDPVAR